NIRKSGIFVFIFYITVLTEPFMVSRVSPKKRCQEGRLAISGNNGFGGYFCEAQAEGFKSLPVKL
ncbi:TPA: hypothetical protein ACSXU0_006550, partial [Pseudomonas aeruginosa]